MSTKDVITQNLLNGFGGSDITTAEIVITLGITFLIAMYLFAVYRIVTENAFYSRNFNISMVAMSLITAGIILGMQSSLVISLGMVGALSIVRFRTAIKEPMDLLFLFWSIGTGIICGAGLYKVGVILAVCVTLAIALLKVIPENNAGQMLFVVYGKDADGKAIENAIKSNGRLCRIKSKNISNRSVSAVYEIKVKDTDALIKSIDEVEGVTNVTVTAHDGEFRG